MINVGVASIAHKIVKIDYIALQRKSLKIKEELNRDRVDRNGDGIGAHEVVSTVG